MQSWAESPHLLPDYEDLKCVRQNAWPGPGLLCSRSRRRAKFCANGIDHVRLGIKLHRTCAASGGNALDDAVLVGRVLVDNDQRAFSTRSKRKLSIRIEAVGVHAISDRQCSDYLARVGVYDGHHFVVATCKEPAVGDVHGEATRAFARGERPNRLNLQPLG